MAWVSGAGPDGNIAETFDAVVCRQLKAQATKVVRKQQPQARLEHTGQLRASSVTAAAASPLRTQNRNAVALAPESSVDPVGLARRSTARQSILARWRRRRNAGEYGSTGSWRLRICRMRDEARNQRVGQEIGRETSRKDAEQTSGITSPTKGHVMAARSSSGDPGAARLPMAAAVITTTTATGRRPAPAVRRWHRALLGRWGGIDPGFSGQTGEKVH